MNRPRPRHGGPVRARAGAAGTIRGAEPSWPCPGRTAARQIRVRRCCPSGDPQPGALRAKVAARPGSARSRPYPPRRPGPSICGNRGISRCCRHDCLLFAVLAAWLVPPGWLPSRLARPARTGRQAAAGRWRRSALCSRRRGEPALIPWPARPMRDLTPHAESSVDAAGPGRKASRTSLPACTTASVARCGRSAPPAAAREPRRPRPARRLSVPPAATARRRQPR
jgi:hypothetical protein